MSAGCGVQTSHVAATDVFFPLISRLRPGAGSQVGRWTGFVPASLLRPSLDPVCKQLLSRLFSVQKEQLVFQEENVNTMYFTRSRWQADAQVSETGVYF